MGYGILFVVGVLTSLHCIAMCGGINLSQCISYKTENDNSKFSKFKPSLMYNTGRVISYTIIGGVVGAIGSAVSFSGSVKGIVAIISGVFMMIMGLNTLNIFPWLRKINPRMPKIFTNKIHNGSNKGPFYVGLLNGLMPCGPLQAMQLYALGTGSFTAGSISMFLFSLGTVPLMFGFGAISTLLSKKFTYKMMKVSAILVMVLGIIMMNRGLNLSGINLDLALAAPQTSSSNIAKVQDGVQFVNTKIEPGNYSPIIVQKGIPVKWTITATADDLNGCNNPVTIPKYNKQYKLVPGDNLIEFTPAEEGTINYTCWMGMISSTIKVVSDISAVSDKDAQQINDQSQTNNSNSALGAGGCCAASAKATKFAGGRIPTDKIQVAQIKDDIQEVTINVNDEGYSPAVAVVQKGIKLKVKFNDEKLNSCNNIVIFPEYNAQLDFQNGQIETPEFIPTQDFTFQCWMGMLHGYIKVVDDLKNINLDEVKNEVKDYKPAISSGGGCCGG
jgi:sulfite exporter TauE/SafE